MTKPLSPIVPNYTVEERSEGWSVVHVLVTLGSEQAADAYLRNLLGLDKPDVKAAAVKGHRAKAASQIVL